MDGLFHFVEKKVILNTLGRITRSYELYIRREGEFFTGVAQGICFRGILIEKIVLRWNKYSFCSYMGHNNNNNNNLPIYIARISMC